MDNSQTTLQESLVEARLSALSTQMCIWEKSHSERHELEAQILDTQRTTLQMALDISSAEIARRLDSLNGEAGRLREMQATYVPRELVDLRLSKMDYEIGRLLIAEANMRGQVIAYSAAIATAIGIITFVLGKYF